MYISLNDTMPTLSLAIFTQILYMLTWSKSTFHIEYQNYCQTQHWILYFSNFLYIIDNVWQNPPVLEMIYGRDIPLDMHITLVFNPLNKTYGGCPLCSMTLVFKGLGLCITITILMLNTVLIIPIQRLINRGTDSYIYLGLLSLAALERLIFPFLSTSDGSSPITFYRIGSLSQVVEFLNLPDNITIYVDETSPLITPNKDKRKMIYLFIVLIPQQIDFPYLEVPNLTLIIARCDNQLYTTGCFYHMDERCLKWRDWKICYTVPVDNILLDILSVGWRTLFYSVLSAPAASIIANKYISTAIWYLYPTDPIVVVFKIGRIFIGLPGYQIPLVFVHLLPYDLS